MRDSIATHGGAGPQAGLAQTLARALGEAGFAARCAGDAVLLPSGLRVVPSLLETHVLDDGGVATLTRVVALHDPAFPQGLPELLHAAGTDAAQALADGFAAWVRGALPVLEDVVRPGGSQNALLAIRFAGPGIGVFKVYQAMLGPILQLGQDTAYTEDEESCPACMVTRLQDLLRDRLAADACTGITLVAGRDADGKFIADCRINGQPFAEGAARLLAYAQSWPGTGVEIRSQYVIVRPPRAAGATT